MNGPGSSPRKRPCGPSRSSGWSFFTVNPGVAVIGLGPPGFPRPPVRPPPADGSLPFHMLGRYAVIQMVLLGLMILLYVGFRIYYARKYGDWDSDEEQS